MRIVSYFEDGKIDWCYVENQNRGCWYSIEWEEMQNMIGPIEGAHLAAIKNKGFDPAKLPHIEDQDKAVQALWYNISDSENNMWFVDKPGYTGGDDPDWVLCGLSQEEFERQVDAAIKKYHLEDVIVKNEDDETLYTCYGDFQSAFSERWVQHD